MIIVYSHLKKLLPNLPTSGRKLADDFTLIGHFCAGLQTIDGDDVYDLEIKAANRPDCLGYFGIIHDLIAFYGLNKPDLFQANPSYANQHISQKSQNFKITIDSSATPYIKAILACHWVNLKISPSPSWLIHLLTLHKINPVNNLVDLTNYIMLLYGIPCHAFDAQKVNQTLSWTTSLQTDNFQTLDGTNLKLQAGNLVIKSQNTPVSLSSIGGSNSGIDSTSQETIVEIAVYDPTRVHQDNRALDIQTEAGSRLEKFLDPSLLNPAFQYLKSQIQELCGGSQIGSDFIFTNYQSSQKLIPFDPNLPSLYAGIPISTSDSLRLLKQLGCTLNDNQTVTPPSFRTDISQEEDLIEEVIRLYGYNHIPTNQPIDSTLKNDITPDVVKLSETLKNLLFNLGYDEVRSWPIIKSDQKIPKISENNYIETENSMNEEYHTLRQSLIESLVSQVDSYSRLKVKAEKLFEIGKIFYQKENQYQESTALGIYTQNPEDLTTLANQIGIPLVWKNFKNFYQTILTGLSGFKSSTIQTPASSAYELNSQLVLLDTTLVYPTAQNPQELIYLNIQKINSPHLWSLIIKDYYLDPKTNTHHYTLTACYFNCDSETAKQIHQKTFGSK